MSPSILMILLSIYLNAAKETIYKSIHCELKNPKEI